MLRVGHGIQLWVGYGPSRGRIGPRRASLGRCRRVDRSPSLTAPGLQKVRKGDPGWTKPIRSDRLLENDGRQKVGVVLGGCRHTGRLAYGRRPGGDTVWLSPGLYLIASKIYKLDSQDWIVGVVD